LGRVQVSAFPHHRLEIGEFALVDEQHQFAGLGEVALHGEQRQRGQAVIAVAPHGGRRHHQQRSPQAITGGVHLPPDGETRTCLLGGSPLFSNDPGEKLPFAGFGRIGE
jgi:hypothetical protein